VSGAKTEMLAKQMSICHLTRAIGIALFVVSIEISLYAVYWFFNRPSMPFTFVILVYALSPAVVFASGIFLTLGAYSRFANFLFPLVYASWKTPTAPVAESSKNSR
jgi:hypothetical protein